MASHGVNPQIIQIAGTCSGGFLIADCAENAVLAVEKRRGLGYCGVGKLRDISRFRQTNGGKIWSYEEW